MLASIAGNEWKYLVKLQYKAESYVSPIVSIVISIVGVFVSGCIGALTVWLAVRKRLEDEVLGRATRKTTAMQLLSDEEFTLEQVRDECVTMDTLVQVGSFGKHRDHLFAEARRIRSEADAMLAEVRVRRQSVEKSLPTLSAEELEAVIAAPVERWGWAADNAGLRTEEPTCYSWSSSDFATTTWFRSTSA